MQAFLSLPYNFGRIYPPADFLLKRLPRLSQPTAELDEAISNCTRLISEYRDTQSLLERQAAEIAHCQTLIEQMEEDAYKQSDDECGKEDEADELERPLTSAPSIHTDYLARIKAMSHPSAKDPSLAPFKGDNPSTKSGSSTSGSTTSDSGSWSGSDGDSSELGSF